MKHELAFLLAAGLGSRMAPLTEKTPKPLLTVFGKPLIETTIDALEKRGVDIIYVIVGHLFEQFHYLTQKYENVRLVFNPDYATKNNIASIEKVAHIMRGNDCFICESDFYITDSNLYCGDYEQSCYFGRTFSGYTDDWVLEKDETGRLTRIGKTGHDCYLCCGNVFLKAKDSTFYADLVMDLVKDSKNDGLYWDLIIGNALDKMNMTVHEVKQGQMYEFDSVQELASYDSSYKKYL